MNKICVCVFVNQAKKDHLLSWVEKIGIPVNVGPVHTQKELSNFSQACNSEL